MGVGLREDRVESFLEGARVDPRPVSVLREMGSNQVKSVHAEPMSPDIMYVLAYPLSENWRASWEVDLPYKSSGL